MNRQGDDARQTDWQDIIAFLSERENHKPVPQSIERIDTHISVVLLAGEFAYKIKKPVKFPFLDFSTPESRHEACAHEIKVNLRTAPELYLGVVPVTFSPRRGLEIDGDGQPVEWIVKMRRFDQKDLYVHLAEAGALAETDFVALARTISSFHALADRHIEPGFAADALARLIDENDEALQKHAGLFPQDAALALSAESRRQLTILRPMLDERARLGFVRHCHGDLHLSNIVRQGGQPVLFDAVEFDDRIATVDILDDLAFLLMDLWFRQMPRAANLVLNEYLKCKQSLENLAGLVALPLYLSTRAIIRAKAAAYRMANLPDGAKADAAQTEARAYFFLGEGFLKPCKPTIMAIGGLSGSGKSTLARELRPFLGRAPGAVHLRSDVERKAMFAVGETERLPENAYTPEINAIVYRLMWKKARIALRAGHSVIVDAVQARSGERAWAEAVAAAENANFLGIWLSAPQDVLVGRVESRQGDASDATAEVVRAQAERGVGELTWPILDASQPFTALVKEAERLIGARGIAYKSGAVSSSVSDR